MSRYPAFQWYPADYLSDYKTARLSLEEDGAYRLVLDHMWHDSDEQCVFPLNYSALGGIWHVCPEDAERILDTLMAPGVALFKIVKRGRGSARTEYLLSKRLQSVVDTMRAYSDKQSAAGKKGAGRRWSRGDSNPNGTPIEVPMGSDGSSLCTLPSSSSADQTPVSSRSSDSQRPARDREVDQVQTTLAISYWEGKLERPLNADELASVKRWVRTYGLDATTAGIGYAFQDGFAADLRRVAGQIKALSKGAAE